MDLPFLVLHLLLKIEPVNSIDSASKNLEDNSVEEPSMILTFALCQILH